MGYILVFVIGFWLGLKMEWTSIVTDFPKPLGWWYHKVMCELSFNFFGVYSHGYNFHLNVMVKKYGINLYGNRIN
jgi:hypothetical protein